MHKSFKKMEGKSRTLKSKITTWFLGGFLIFLVVAFVIGIGHIISIGIETIVKWFPR